MVYTYLPKSDLFWAKTTSENAPKEVVEDIIHRYMDNLTGMGYTLQWRTKVLKSTMIGYMKILQRVG